MAQPFVNETSRVRAPGDTEGANKPGAFTAFSDGTATFCGNGESTCEQVTAHFIKHRVEKEKDEGLQAFNGNPAAATFGAQLFLQQNRHLGPQMTPASKIKQGEMFHMDATPLKKILAQFVDKLPELTKMVENMTNVASAGFDAPSGATKFSKEGSRGGGLPIPTI